MTEYSKFNIVYRLQKWMDSVPGQTFLNYAYSWGASIVILGTLFKLTHLYGADFMLFVGMGTEVCVFFISAFDRPFDKTADGRDIPTRVTEEYLETGSVEYSEQEKEAAEREAGVEKGNPSKLRPAVSGGSGGGVVIIGGGSGKVSGVGKGGSVAATAQGVVSGGEPISFNGNGEESAEGQLQPNYVPQMSAEEAASLNEAQGNYVDQLKELVETLKKVNEQSVRLTRDSEEMENLNRTLTGISKVYEMQLKGASQQIGTIDQINEQSRKMAQQIEQLNKIYTRMIEAMTVNMHVAAPGTAAPAAPTVPTV
jgi:hypothetical protein